MTDNTTTTTNALMSMTRNQVAMEPMASINAAADAAAASSRAEIECAYIMAMRNPRNIDDVRGSLLRECDRPNFAATVEYRKPIGSGFVSGLSIRAAEAAVRLMGNIHVYPVTTYEDDEQMKIRVSVTDLETNSSFKDEITVRKTVERRSSDGREVVSQRVNTTGQTVYIVKATEDEIANKKAAMMSKVIRNLALRLIPADIQDEMKERSRTTCRNQDAKDPDAEKKRICDAFLGMGVRPSSIMDFLGHDLTAIQPAELAELRAVFSAIRDGEATWVSVMESRSKEKEIVTPSAPVPATPSAAKETTTPAPTQNAEKPEVLPPEKRGPGRPRKPGMGDLLDAIRVAGLDQQTVETALIQAQLIPSGFAITALDTAKIPFVIANLKKIVEGEGN